MIAWPLDGHKYFAESIGAYCGTRTRGVFAADSCFAVRPAGGFKITMADGLAWLHADKYWGLAVYDKAEQSWTLPVGSGKQGRYFAVAIQYDKTRNEVGAVLKTGEYAEQPKKPAPVRDAYFDEIIVATILQKPGAVEITSADITDERTNEAMCGLMRDGVTGLPSEMLYQQIRTRFDQLLGELEGLLDGNVAANLQSQISAVDAKTAVYTATFAASGWARSGDHWTQTVSCTGMQAAFDTGPAWIKKTGNRVADDAAQAALDLLNDGYIETLDGHLRATVYDSPPGDAVRIYLSRA